MTMLLLQTALDKGESEPGEACLLIVWGGLRPAPLQPGPGLRSARGKENWA